MKVSELLTFLSEVPLDAEVAFEYCMYYEGDLFGYFEEERVVADHFSYEHANNRVVLKEY